MTTVGYGISERVGLAAWDRMTSSTIDELHELILRDDARVVRAAFFAPLPGSGNPSSTFYQVAFRESTTKKLHAFEFHGKHKRLPISVNSSYFDNGKWVFTDNKSKNASAPKRKASVNARKPRSKRAVQNEDDIEEDQDEEDEDEDDESSVVGSIAPMQLLEHWANMDQDDVEPQVQVYEDDLRSTRSSRRRLSPNAEQSTASLYSRLGPRLGEGSNHRQVDFNTPAPAPSESGFSSAASEGGFSFSSSISSTSSNATARGGQQPVRRSARLSSVAPSVAGSDASSCVLGVGRLQVDNDMILDEGEEIIDYVEDPNPRVIVKREEDDISMNGNYEVRDQDEEMYA